MKKGDKKFGREQKEVLSLHHFRTLKSRKQKEIIERLYIEEKKDEGKYKPFVLRDI